MSFTDQRGRQRSGTSPGPFPPSRNAPPPNVKGPPPGPSRGQSSQNLRGSPPATPPRGQSPIARSAATPPGSPLVQQSNQKNNRGIAPSRPKPHSDESDWKKLYESEMRMRKILEQQRGELQRENVQLKKNLGNSRQRMHSEVKKREVAEEKLENIQKAPPAPAPEEKIKKEKQSRNEKVAQATMNVESILSKLLPEMEELENNIKRSEAARERAEAELVEVAMYKQASDDSLKELITDLVTMSGSLSTILSSHTEVDELRENIETWQSELGSRLRSLGKRSDRNQDIEQRKTIFELKLKGKTEAPPPAPSPPPPPGPPAPPQLVIAGGPTRAKPTRALPDARASTLLSQIRKGKDLNKIDMTAMKRERDLFHANSRTSIAMLSSLQNTLRNALNVRQDAMNEKNTSYDDWDDW